MMTAETDGPRDRRESARAIAELARRRARDTEADGQVNPAILQAMLEAGLPLMLKPDDDGGFTEFIDICGILAEGCMSTGWCNFVWGVHNILVGLYPNAVQDAVWKDPHTLTSASLGPAGRGVRESDVIVLNGRWQFCSGSDHAEWLLLGFMLPDEEPHLALVHRSEYALIEGSWDVMGLRGTGSKDASCTDVRIPLERVLPFSSSLVPYGGLLVLVIVGPVIGGAQAAVNAYRDQVKERVTIGGKPLVTQQSVLLRLAEASAEVDAARTLTLAAADLLNANPSPDDYTTARIIRDTAFAARLCNQATRRVFEAAGGHALHESNDLQRIFRDVTAGCAHARLGWDGQALPWANMAVT